MDYTKLGNTEIEVSKVCLGTMTYGDQNTEAEAHAQLDYALAQGINFIDTAEMYPVPPKAETFTRTETMIGPWLKNKRAIRLFWAPKRLGLDVTLVGSVVGRRTWIETISAVPSMIH